MLSSHAPARARNTRVLSVAALAVLGACAPALRPLPPAVGPAPAPARAAVVERAPAAPAPEAERPAPVSTEAALHARHLMVPIAGIDPSRLHDTFNEARDGGARTHRALDILAPRGTPILSADDGYVYRLAKSALGGITVYAIDPFERFIYYYAHLDHYREHLAEGERLSKGDVIGYVGTTGNAPPDTPHLHFQVMLMRPDRYWDGPAVNPLPYFERIVLAREVAGQRE